MPPHITYMYPLIMACNVQENAVFIHKSSTTKNLPTVGEGGGGGTPHPPPARSLRSLALVPLLKNPGYASEYLEAYLEGVVVLTGCKTNEMSLIIKHHGLDRLFHLLQSTFILDFRLITDL